MSVAERSTPAQDVAAGNGFAATLTRGLSLMAAFDAEDGWLGNTELVRRTQLPKSTVSRLSAGLVAFGYLQRNARGQLRPGLRLMTRVYPVLSCLPIREQARPRLQALAEQIDGVVAIVAANGGSGVMIEVARGLQCQAAHPDEGYHAPMIQLAAGRALLAAADEAQRGLLLGRSTRQWPALWALHRETVFRSIDQVFSDGHCISAGDLEAGSTSLALPLLALPDGPPLALNCSVSGPRARPPYLQQQLAPLALALADALREDIIAARTVARAR